LPLEGAEVSANELADRCALQIQVYLFLYFDFVCVDFTLIFVLCFILYTQTTSSDPTTTHFMLCCDAVEQRDKWIAQLDDLISKLSCIPIWFLLSYLF
jgi:hypothetical protein